MPRHPRFSDSTSTLTSSVYSDLARRAREREGVVHALHVGDTYLLPIEGARAEAQRVADHPRLHNYAAVQGEPALLDAIVDRLSARAGRPIDRECVQVMAGATSGLSVVSRTILDAGDEVLLPSPFWPLIRGIITSRGAIPVQVPFYDRLGEPDFDPEKVLEEAVTERTTALYLNTPNNPTSRVVPESVLEVVARVAKRHDLWVLADEAYEDLWLGTEPPAPMWNRPDLRDRTIASHTLSKSYGLAGARVGYSHGPAEVMRAVRDLQTYQTYCAPRPMQLGGVRALREGDGWLAEARRLYGEAGRMAADALRLPRPEGGTFLFFDASPFLGPEEPLMGFLGRCLDAGVLLTPGSASGEHYGSFVRLCFTAVPPEQLADALTRLSGVLFPAD